MCAAPFLLAGAPKQADRSPASLQWGIYQMYWGRANTRYRSALDGQFKKLATTPDYVMYYRDLGRPFPKEGVKVIREAGATPIISLELWNWHDSRPKQLPNIIEGKYDPAFRQWAEDAKADGGRVLLRFGFEFNGDWFTWGGDPERFVAAWRRVRGIFNEVGASNVEWVWAANVTSHPDGPANDLTRYYPGDEFVDWVAVDGYNWGDGFKEWHRWSSFEELFHTVLDRFAKLYPDKPVMIAEFGCPEGKPNQKSTWIREAYRSILRRPQIKAVVWFNLDKRREGELDFRIDTSPESLQAFNETFARKRDGRSDGGK